MLEVVHNIKLGCENEAVVVAVISYNINSNIDSCGYPALPSTPAAQDTL